MQRLFSPWRSAYIQTFKSGKKLKGCLFCKIAKSRKDRQNLIVWRGGHTYVVMNRYPYNSGHVLIVPYRHTKDFGGLSGDESAEIMKVSAMCLRAMTKLSKPHGFNFGANLGRVAGAGIEDHLHFHIVPRWNGDTNFMPVLAETKVISEGLKTMWKELRPRLARM